MRRVVWGLAIAIAAGGLSGCALFETTVTCVSWVVFDSDEDRTRDADLVVVTDAVSPDGTMKIYDFEANAYQVEIGDVEKGDLRPGDTIRVGSTADNCSDRPYGDGDPMLGDGSLRLFLSEDEGQWRTLTPWDGVWPAP